MSSGVGGGWDDPCSNFMSKVVCRTHHCLETEAGVVQVVFPGSHGLLRRSRGFLWAVLPFFLIFFFDPTKLNCFLFVVPVRLMELSINYANHLDNISPGAWGFISYISSVLLSNVVTLLLFSWARVVVPRLTKGWVRKTLGWTKICLLLIPLSYISLLLFVVHWTTRLILLFLFLSTPTNTISILFFCFFLQPSCVQLFHQASCWLSSSASQLRVFFWQFSESTSSFQTSQMPRSISLLWKKDQLSLSVSTPFFQFLVHSSKGLRILEDELL